MPEPVSLAVIATVSSTAGSSISIAKFISDIKNTPTDVKTCFDLTHRVQEDLETLINLRARHEKHLLTDPDTLKRLDRIIYATQDSIFDVHRLLEGCRKEVYLGNAIPLGSKMKWVLGDSTAFARRTPTLQQQHAALNVEILSLRQIEMLKPLERMATTTFENVELLGMERKRIQRRDLSSERDNESAPSYESVTAPNSSMIPAPLVLRRPLHAEASFCSGPASTITSEKSLPYSEIEVQEDEDEDDAESLFYRDLRKQEEERQRRLAARKR